MISTKRPVTLVPSGLAQAMRTHRTILLPTIIAGPSRLPLASTYSTWHSRKGKEKVGTDDFTAVAYRSSSVSNPSLYDAVGQPCNRYQRRSFHASARRNALPLIPAAIGIFKSTTLLAAVTTVARILVSFFPLGTLATFKLSRGVRWLSSETQRPDASPEAEEFYQMWCKGEKGIRPTLQEAAEIPNGTMLPDGGCRGPNGRVSYATPVVPRQFRAVRTNDDPTQIQRTSLQGKDQPKSLARYMRGTRFYLPELPPASIPYYERLSTDEQREVDALRRYWVSLRMFKDTLRLSRWALSILLLLPVGLVLSAYACGLERVPLTGRWRIILLTPEEEDHISSNLAGANWYRSVINLLTTPEKPAPRVVPIEDWRWRWVHDVLRRLEAAALAECQGTDPPYQRTVYIPPSHYPVKPRARVSSMLHSVLPGGEPGSGQEHLTFGPPYSLMIMDKDEMNAFSYGFGGKGAGGVVVYTGLLDSILRESSPPVPPQPQASGGIFGGLFLNTPPRPPPIVPTETQTLHLACVLAHEMGHLLLSHHLETLSQQQVLWPSILGLTMDLTRAFIWPITFLLGPTVNDALANVGRTSAEEMSERYGQIGFQYKHEYEADLAGLRILALAGFDPNAALDHFSRSVADLHEMQPLDKSDDTLTGRLFKLWTTATHPTSEQRSSAIHAELDRWKAEAKKRSDSS